MSWIWPYAVSVGLVTWGWKSWGEWQIEGGPRYWLGGSGTAVMILMAWAIWWLTK